MCYSADTLKSDMPTSSKKYKYDDLWRHIEVHIYNAGESVETYFFRFKFALKGMPYTTQANTPPPGPIFKSRLLRSEYTIAEPNHAFSDNS